MDLKEIGCDYMDWTHVAQDAGQMTGSCNFGSHKSGDFIDQLNGY
jgi:hypothetical protein